MSYSSRHGGTSTRWGRTCNRTANPFDERLAPIGRNLPVVVVAVAVVLSLFVFVPRPRVPPSSTPASAPFFAIVHLAREVRASYRSMRD